MNAPSIETENLQVWQEYLANPEIDGLKNQVSEILPELVEAKVLSFDELRLVGTEIVYFSDGQEFTFSPYSYLKHLGKHRPEIFWNMLKEYEINFEDEEYTQFFENPEIFDNLRELAIGILRDPNSWEYEFAFELSVMFIEYYLLLKSQIAEYLNIPVEKYDEDLREIGLMYIENTHNINNFDLVGSRFVKRLRDVKKAKPKDTKFEYFLQDGKNNPGYRIIQDSKKLTILTSSLRQEIIEGKLDCLKITQISFLTSTFIFPRGTSAESKKNLDYMMHIWGLIFTNPDNLQRLIYLISNVEYDESILSQQRAHASHRKAFSAFRNALRIFSDLGISQKQNPLFKEKPVLEKQAKASLIKELSNSFIDYFINNHIGYISDLVDKQRTSDMPFLATIFFSLLPSNGSENKWKNLNTYTLGLLFLLLLRKIQKQNPNYRVNEVESEIINEIKKHFEESKANESRIEIGDVETYRRIKQLYTEEIH